jgi:hypothetical protein
MALKPRGNGIVRIRTLLPQFLFYILIGINSEMILISSKHLPVVEYKPYKISIPARWKFSGLVQGLSKHQVQELQSIRIPDTNITITHYFPIHVFFDQFRFKKYLKNDIPPLKPKKISMILLLLFFWLGFFISLVATALAYFLAKPEWMIDTFCIVGFLLLAIAGGTTFWDHNRKRKWTLDHLDSGIDGSVDAPEISSKFIPDLSDGEGIIIILIIMIAILLAMFFFVFIWLPILYVILNLITLGDVGDRYRTLEITIKNPQKKVLNWLAGQIILAGGYLSRNWDPWIIDARMRHIAKKTREAHHTFINTTIAFTIVSFVFAFFLVAYRIFNFLYLYLTALIFGMIALGFFVFLIFLVLKARSEKKQLFSQISRP